MKKALVIVPVLVALLLTMPVAAAEGYSDALTPGIFGNTTITWEIIDAPEVPFSLFWAGTGNWFAQSNSQLTFTVTDIHEDVEGQLTLGNLTLTANDTDLAQDLTLGVWGLTPFLPGLVIKNGVDDISALIEIAEDSAEHVLGNYLNGTMQIDNDEILVNGITYSCVTFFYEQDPTGFGSQRTFLAYDNATGVLVQADTTYSFGTPYSLILELSSISSPGGMIPIIALSAVIGIVVLVVVVKIVKK
ncbi:MAG: hypothetical protein ACW98Y_02960 [Candidatus Thorarchaeota archaeon]|jgi:hypothetical protein